MKSTDLINRKFYEAILAFEESEEAQDYFYQVMDTETERVRKNGEKETEIYYEFLAFYKYSNINFLEFSKKGMMHMKLLERKKALIEGALADAFGAPVGISMSLEGSGAAEKKVSDVAREVINQAYDVFGRDKINIDE